MDLAAGAENPHVVDSPAGDAENDDAEYEECWDCGRRAALSEMIFHLVVFGYGATGPGEEVLLCKDGCLGDGSPRQTE